MFSKPVELGLGHKGAPLTLTNAVTACNEFLDYVTVIYIYIKSFDTNGVISLCE